MEFICPYFSAQHPSKLAQGPLPNPGQQQMRATRAALLVSLNHVHPWETGSENVRGYQSTWCPGALRGPRLPALLCCASPQGQTLLSPQPGLCRAGPAAPGALLQLNGSTGSFHPPWAEPHHCRALTESRGQLPSCAPAASTPGKAPSGAGSELRQRAVAAAYSMQLQLGVKKTLARKLVTHWSVSECIAAAPLPISFFLQPQKCKGQGGLGMVAHN